MEEAGSPMVANPNMVMTSVPRAADTAAGDRACMEEKEDVDQCLMIILEIMGTSIVTREKVVTVVVNRDMVETRAMVVSKEDMEVVIVINTAEVKATAVSKDTVEIRAMVVSGDMVETKGMVVSKENMEMRDASRNPRVGLQVIREDNRDVATTGEAREMGTADSRAISNLKEEEGPQEEEEVEMDRVMVAARRIKARAASPEVVNLAVHLLRTKRVAALRKVRLRHRNGKR